MAARGKKSPRWMSWTGLVYYGETVGFVLAWIAGATAIWVAASSPDPASPRVDQVASVDSTEGLN